MSNYIEYFTNYIINNYDINDDLIVLKYYHSLRVAWLMVMLSKKLNLSEEDTNLAFKIGLCHDLGRFYEVVRNGKFNNRVFDHGTYSNKILYNDGFINYMDINEHLLFRKAIYCHNKKDLADNLNNRERLFANMLRDVDKIDILRIRLANYHYEFKTDPTLVVLYNYMNDLNIDLHDIHNKSDSTILSLSFIKDLCFDESLDLLLDNNFLDNLINKIYIEENKLDIFNSLINKLKERRGIEYVR